MLLDANTHKFFTEDVLNLLRKKDIYSVLDFLRLDNRLIERYTCLTYPEIIEVKKCLAKSFSAVPVNGLSYYQKTLTNSALISTGISELDNLLQGGLFTGTIYEFCGAADSEKLHFVLTILRNLLCGGHKTYFLDTKKDLSAKLMRAKLAKEKEQDECLNLLTKILIKHISNKHDLISALFDIKRELEGGLAVRVIIIHSLSVLFLGSTDYTGNNNILNHLANILRFLAIEHNVVIILTNLITAWSEGGFQNSQGAKEKIACGKYWRGVPNIRVKIDKKSTDNFEISLLKYNNVFSKDKCNVTVSVFK